MEALSIKKLCAKLVRLLSLILFLFIMPCHAQLNVAEDCINATRICDASQNYYFETEGPGIIDDAHGLLQIYCLNQAGYTQWENLAAWFVFTPQYTGEFGFLICPEVTTDNWNFALFNNPSCSDLENPSYRLFCNGQTGLAVTEGCTGMGFKNGYGGGGSNGLGPYFNIQAGTTYVLYVEADILPITTPRRATLSFQGQVVIDHPDLFDFAGCTMATPNFELQTKVKVFPNPFENFINIESEIDLKTIELYDVMGKLVIKQDFVKRLDTSKIAKGFYLLKLITEDGSVINKKIMR